MIGPGGVQPQDVGTVWRFETKDPDAWQVTLAPTFVSLSAKRYCQIHSSDSTIPPNCVGGGDASCWSNP